MSNTVTYTIGDIVYTVQRNFCGEQTVEEIIVSEIEKEPNC